MSENETVDLNKAHNIPVDTASLAELAKFFQNQSSTRHPTKKRATRAQRQARRRMQKASRRANRGTGKGETRSSLRKR